jgi:hypothetical protein
MIWTVSDGTTVELGGNVEGATVLAQQLRQELARPGLQVTIWPLPDGKVDLDPNNPALLDAWLREEIAWRNRARGLPLKLTSPDNVPALPPSPWADQPHEPDTVY